MKAFKITIFGFDPVVVFAERRGQASFHAYHSCRDAGYSVRFADVVSCKRVPKYDDRTGVEPKRCYSESFVSTLMPKSIAEVSL